MEEYKNSEFKTEKTETSESDTNKGFEPAAEDTSLAAPESSEPEKAEESATYSATEESPAQPESPACVPEPPRPPADHPAAKFGGAVPPPRAPHEGRPTFAPPSGGAQTPPPQHSGEYRYVPPYSGIGSNSTRPESSPVTPPPRPEPRPQKKEKQKTVRTFSTTALILILVGTVLLSFASGMLGAMFVSGGLDFIDEPATQTQKPSEDNENKDSNLVIDKADEDDEDESSSDKLTGSYDITDVCAVVSPSVVEITTEFNETYYGYYQYVQEGAGSGVIVSEDGYIITNAHVITNSENGKLADTIKIRLNSGDEYTAKIIGSDADSDIALLKVDAKGLSAATVGNSSKIKVGEQVIAVGNPLGQLGGTVTSGIVSATNREITVENNKMTLIQIDAAINPGNSGGGLFNTDGELIGIVNAKTTDVTVEGLGFAIPVNEAISVIEELETHGYVTGKTYLGISLSEVTDAFTAYYYFRSESTGVYITNVQEGYNDDVLQYGDRITAIDDNEVSSSADVKEAIASSEVGDKLTFTVSREGKLIDVEVTCYEYVPESNVSFDNN